MQDTKKQLWAITGYNKKPKKSPINAWRNIPIQTRTLKFATQSSPLLNYYKKHVQQMAPLKNKLNPILVTTRSSCIWCSTSLLISSGFQHCPKKISQQYFLNKDHTPCQTTIKDSNNQWHWWDLNPGLLHPLEPDSLSGDKKLL